MRRQIPQYRIVVEPLPSEDGGGFVAYVPDLPGCMADGETDHEALDRAHDAIESWIGKARDMGRNVPQPTRVFAHA